MHRLATSQIIIITGLLVSVVLCPQISESRTQKGRTAQELKNPYDWKKDYSGSKPVTTSGKDITPTVVPQPTKVIKKKSSKKDELFYNRYFRKGEKGKDPEQLQRQKHLNELKRLKQHRRSMPKRSPTPVLTEKQKEIKELIHMLGTEKHRRATAVERLSMIGDEAVPALRRALRHRYKHVRVGALHALRNIFAEKAIPDMQRLLHDKEPEVRGEAARTLGRMRHRGSAERIGRLLNDSSIRVRRDAVNALGRLKRAPAAEHLLLLALEKNKMEIKVEAAQVLAAFESPQVVEALLRATYEKDRNLIAYATRSLGEIADPQSEERIKVLSNHKDEFIREEARQALDYF